MTEYLIAFNGEWIPDLTDEDFREASKAVRMLRAELTAAGVLVFLGGLDDEAPVFSVDTSSGTPVFTDGPYVETKEHLGGFTVVDVADEEAAKVWAGKIATACGWPQEVRRFRTQNLTGLPRRPSERPMADRDLVERFGVQSLLDRSISGRDMLAHRHVRASTVPASGVRSVTASRGAERGRRQNNAPPTASR